MTPEPEDLLEHVVDYLCAEQAEAVADLADDEIRRRAALAIARAQSHGFTQAEPITAFANLMFLVAPDFDRQPAIARALAANAPEPQRIALLFEKTKEADWDAAAGATAGWESLK
jgi:hypothetical protein